MKFRYKIIQTVISLLILTAGLLFIYTSAHEGEEISFLQADGLGVLIIVFVVYFAVTMIIELLLVYMRQDTWFAKIVKSLVAFLLVITLFPMVLFFMLWMFGYTIEADLVPVLTVITLVRALVNVWLGRLFRRRSATV